MERLTSLSTWGPDQSRGKSHRKGGARGQDSKFTKAPWGLLPSFPPCGTNTPLFIFPCLLVILSHLSNRSLTKVFASLVRWPCILYMDMSPGHKYQGLPGREGAVDILALHTTFCKNNSFSITVPRNTLGRHFSLSGTLACKGCQGASRQGQKGRETTKNKSVGLSGGNSPFMFSASDCVGQCV